MHGPGRSTAAASGTLVYGKLGGNSRILYGVGYSGTGVAPSLLGGRILASSALDRIKKWSAPAKPG